MVRKPLLAATLNGAKECIYCLLHHASEKYFIERIFHCVHHAVLKNDVECLKIFLKNKYLSKIFLKNSTIAKTALDRSYYRITKHLLEVWGIRGFVKCFETGQKYINEQVVCRKKEKLSANEILAKQDYFNMLEKNYAIQHHLDYRKENQLHTYILKKMVDKGYEFNMKDIYGNTPVSNAIKYGNVEAVRLILMSRNCDIDIADSRGDTPFMKSLRLYNIEIIELFLERMSDSSFIWYYKLIRAIENDDVKLMKKVIRENPKTINYKLVYNLRTIELAALFNSVDAVKFLLDKYRISALSLRKALKIASKRSSCCVIGRKKVQIVACLLKAGAPIKMEKKIEEENTEPQCFVLLQIGGNEVNVCRSNNSLENEARVTIRQLLLNKTEENLFTAVKENLGGILPSPMISYLLYNHDLDDFI